MIPWGNDSNGNTYYWLVKPKTKPDDWTVVLNDCETFEEYAGSMTDYLVAVFKGKVDALAGNFPGEGDFRFVQASPVSPRVKDADRDNPLGIRRRGVGSLQGLAHVLSDRTRDEQHIGVPGRRDEMQPESLQVIEGVVQRMDLKLATIAGASVDLPDREAAAEPLARRPRERPAELCKRRFLRWRKLLRQRRSKQTLKEKLAHDAFTYRSCPE